MVKTALVLSAGGMFGAYQAGAWKALSTVLAPDLVVGTSAGCLNGWAIAGGCDPQELIDFWLDPARAQIMRVRWRWASWKGLWDPAPLERAAHALHQRYQPRIPYALTLTEVPRMRPRLVRGEEVTCRHLVASCAVPCGFPPVEIEGKHYVDGGVLAALPLWAAAACGAARAIAIDALPEMPSAVVRAAARMAYRFGRNQLAANNLVVVKVTHGRVLGSLGDAMHWKAAHARRWIEWGEQDGAAAARRLASDHALPLK